MIVADTDVLIDFLASAEPMAARVARELERGQMCTTVISRFELLTGARSKRQQVAVSRLLAALPTLPLDEPAADRAAQVRREMEAAGTAIGMADSLIAGIVLHRQLALLTRNRRHFDHVAELRLAGD
jgi:tRNA(fMet)-specific endonuclease VapC